jgi:glycosyltransferase involved in cell wall biosynthesis
LHGVPVIASAVGENSYYGAGGAATLVPADATPAQFAQVVVEAIRTPVPTARSRAEATERLLTRYAWPRLTASLPAFYESLLDSPALKR